MHRRQDRIRRARGEWAQVSGRVALRTLGFPAAAVCRRGCVAASHEGWPGEVRRARSEIVGRRRREACASEDRDVGSGPEPRSLRMLRVRGPDGRTSVDFVRSCPGAWFEDRISRTRRRVSRWTPRVPRARSVCGGGALEEAATSPASRVRRTSPPHGLRRRSATLRRRRGRRLRCRSEPRLAPSAA